MQQYKTPPFLRALQALLPDAQITVSALRDWRSMTFNGQQLFLSARMTGEDVHQRARIFSEQLPEHEFAIPGQLVADASVVAIREVGDGVAMAIETLILDD